MRPTGNPLGLIYFRWQPQDRDAGPLLLFFFTSPAMPCLLRVPTSVAMLVSSPTRPTNPRYPYMGNRSPSTVLCARLRVRREHPWKNRDAAQFLGSRQVRSLDAGNLGRCCRQPADPAVRTIPRQARPGPGSRVHKKWQGDPRFPSQRNMTSTPPAARHDQFVFLAIPPTRICSIDFSGRRGSVNVSILNDKRWSRSRKGL